MVNIGCKSTTIYYKVPLKYINKQNATVSQVYYLTFMCGSTCFGRFLAYHQEITTALTTASGFTVGAWQ
jgi:hypothetical protein